MLFHIFLTFMQWLDPDHSKYEIYEQISQTSFINWIKQVTEKVPLEWFVHELDFVCVSGTFMKRKLGWMSTFSVNNGLSLFLTQNYHVSSEILEYSCLEFFYDMLMVHCFFHFLVSTTWGWINNVFINFRWTITVVTSKWLNMEKNTLYVSE